MSADPRQMKRWPKLIMKKFEAARCNPDFKITHVDEDIMGHYYILLQPTGGHYKGQTYIIEFKSQYSGNTFPFNPPLIKFVTSIYHPNISVNGSICVDILKEKDKWSPQYDINAVMSSIILLLDVPNNSSPFNGEAANLYRDCEKNYIKESKMCKDHKIITNIFDQCFIPYVNKTVTHASKNNINMYLQYFNNTTEEKNVSVDKTTKDLSDMKM
jgi:ubiquitin-conjugating enzyme E2 A